MKQLLVAMFALRGHSGCGIGDFGNLLPAIDMAALMGLREVIVCYAMYETLGKGMPLHPAFIDLRQLPAIANRTKASAFAAQAAELDSEHEVNYAKSYNLKMHCLRELYLQDGDSVLSSDGYHAFWRENGDWLEHYAVYCTLRHKYGTGNNRYWSEPDYTRLLEDSNFIKEYSDDIRFHCYVQYLLYRQLDIVRAYAREKDIELTVRNAEHTASSRYIWETASAGQRAELYSRLGFTGSAPDCLQPWVAEAYVRRNTSEAVLLEDLLATTTLTRKFPPLQEVIDPPFDRTSAWCYRMGITLEDVLSHRALLECIRTIISDSNK